MRRKAAADLKEKKENARPNSTRAAGVGGSSSTMLKLYTDESPGLKVDPVVVLVLSVGFIVSVVALHSTRFPNCLETQLNIIQSLPRLQDDSLFREMRTLEYLSGRISPICA